MYVAKVINRGELDEGKIAVFKQCLYVINEYVVEQMGLDNGEIVSINTLTFPDMKHNYQLKRFTIYDRMLYLLMESRNVSYIYRLSESSFECVNKLDRPSIGFMVSKCESGLLFLYLLRDHSYCYQNQSGVCREGNDTVKGFENTCIGSLLIHENRIDDLLENYHAIFQHEISQIIEDDSTNYLYILLVNNHVYCLPPKGKAKCILTHKYDDFPILRLIIFQQKLLTFNATNSIYGLEDHADKMATMTLSESKGASSSLVLRNLGKLRDCNIKDVIFADSFCKCVLIMSSDWEEVLFDPLSSKINLNATQNYDSLINCQFFDGNRLQYIPNAKIYGFSLHGRWWISADGHITYEDLKENTSFSEKIQDKNVLLASNHEVAIVSQQHIIIYYSIGKVFYRTDIKDKIELTKKSTFATELITVSYSAENNYDGFAIDNINTFFRTSFNDDKLHICRFKDPILFSLFTAYFILIQAGKDMFLIVGNRVVEKFELKYTPTSAALLNPSDLIGHQVIALAWDAGIIEIRHLLSFVLLEEITVLNRKIKELVVLDDELRCLDADTDEIFVLQDMRNEGSVVAVEELLMDKHLI